MGHTTTPAATPRRLAWRCTTFALAIIGLGTQAQDFSDVEVTSQSVAGSVYMLQGAGGNVGVSIGADGVFVVDDDYEGVGEKILAAVRALSERPIRYLVNTHWHGDHAGGNAHVADAGAVIVAHRNVRERMSTEQFIEALQREVPPSADEALPVVTFSQELHFHLNGDEIRVRHFPRAHTDGDAIVVFPAANVIHTGDIYSSGRWPFIDTSSGGSIDGTIAAARAILQIGDEQTRIIPGHGPLSNTAELREWLAMLATVRERMVKLIDAGYGRSAALRSRPLKDMEERWGQGFIDADKMVGIAYDDLKAK